MGARLPVPAWTHNNTCSKEHYSKSAQDSARVPQKYFQLLMSPELWWNHSKQDIQEQKLQSVVNGEKITSTASNKLYWTNTWVWSSLNQNKYQKNILTVFGIAVTENTAFFHTGYIIFMSCLNTHTQNTFLTFLMLLRGVGRLISIGLRVLL